jgi:hypothetical protein
MDSEVQMIESSQMWLLIPTDWIDAARGPIDQVGEDWLHSRGLRLGANIKGPLTI